MKPNSSSLTQVQGSKMKMTNLIKSILIAMVATLIFTNTALAQSKVLVVDSDKILRDSKATKAIMSQLQTISKAMDTEMQSQINTIISDQKRLEVSTKGLTNQQLSARPELKKIFTDIQNNKAKANNEKQYKSAEIKKTMDTALKKVNDKLKTIVSAIAAERGADMVIDKRNVLHLSTKNEITADVLRRLDSQLPYVQVTRARIPRQVAQKKK